MPNEFENPIPSYEVDQDLYDPKLKFGGMMEIKQQVYYYYNWFRSNKTQFMEINGLFRSKSTNKTLIINKIISIIDEDISLVRIYQLKDISQINKKLLFSLNQLKNNLESLINDKNNNIKNIKGIYVTKNENTGENIPLRMNRLKNLVTINFYDYIPIDIVNQYQEFTKIKIKHISDDIIKREIKKEKEPTTIDLTKDNTINIININNNSNNLDISLPPDTPNILEIPNINSLPPIPLLTVGNSPHFRNSDSNTISVSPTITKPHHFRRRRHNKAIPEGDEVVVVDDNEVTTLTPSPIPVNFDINNDNNINKNINKNNTNNNLNDDIIHPNYKYPLGCIPKKTKHKNKNKKLGIKNPPQFTGKTQNGKLIDIKSRIKEMYENSDLNQLIQKLQEIKKKHKDNDNQLNINNQNNNNDELNKIKRIKLVKNLLMDNSTDPLKLIKFLTNKKFIESISEIEPEFTILIITIAFQATTNASSTDQLFDTLIYIMQSSYNKYLRLQVVRLIRKLSMNNNKKYGDINARAAFNKTKKSKLKINLINNDDKCLNEEILKEISTFDNYTITDYKYKTINKRIDLDITAHEYQKVVEKEELAKILDLIAKYKQPSGNLGNTNILSIYENLISIPYGINHHHYIRTLIFGIFLEFVINLYPKYKDELKILQDKLLNKYHNETTYLNEIIPGERIKSTFKSKYLSEIEFKFRNRTREDIFKKLANNASKNKNKNLEISENECEINLDNDILPNLDENMDNNMLNNTYQKEIDKINKLILIDKKFDSIAPKTELEMANMLIGGDGLTFGEDPRIPIDNEIGFKIPSTTQKINIVITNDKMHEPIMKIIKESHHLKNYCISRVASLEKAHTSKSKNKYKNTPLPLNEISQNNDNDIQKDSNNQKMDKMEIDDDDEIVNTDNSNNQPTTPNPEPPKPKTKNKKESKNKPTPKPKSRKTKQIPMLGVEVITLHIPSEGIYHKKLKNIEISKEKETLKGPNISTLITSNLYYNRYQSPSPILKPTDDPTKNDNSKNNKITKINKQSKRKRKAYKSNDDFNFNDTEEENKTSTDEEILEISPKVTKKSKRKIKGKNKIKTKRKKKKKIFKTPTKQSTQTRYNLRSRGKIKSNKISSSDSSDSSSSSDSSKNIKIKNIKNKNIKSKRKRKNKTKLKTNQIIKSNTPTQNSDEEIIEEVPIISENNKIQKNKNLKNSKKSFKTNMALLKESNKPKLIQRRRKLTQYSHTGIKFSKGNNKEPNISSKPLTKPKRNVNKNNNNKNNKNNSKINKKRHFNESIETDDNKPPESSTENDI